MPTRSSRNVLAAVLILLGTIMVISSPLNASDGSDHCSDVVVNFDDHDPRPLFNLNPQVGPVAISLAAGTYDIVLTSSDPGHGRGRFLNQMQESWFFTLDNGYVSPVTPDFGDDQTGIAIARTAVTLAAATQITAFWAGVDANIDSVHARVSFTCARQTIVTTTAAPTTTAQTTTTASPTTETPTTTAAPTTSAAPTTTAGPTSPTTILGTPTSVTTAAPLTPTTLASVTTTSLPGQIGGTTEENPDELAFTGLNLNLAIGGFSLIAAGFGLVVFGSMHDRRKLAVVEL